VPQRTYCSPSVFILSSYFLFLFSSTTLFFLFFFLYCYPPHRALHSFPTRRSSDLSTCLDIHAQVIKSRRNIAYFERAVDPVVHRSEEHTSELQSRGHLVCRLLLEKKNKKIKQPHNTVKYLFIILPLTHVISLDPLL